MKRNSRHFNLDAGLRLVADFIILHSAMFAALATIALAASSDTSALVTLRQYYVKVFLPVSPLLIGIYAAMGLYKLNSRALPIRTRLHLSVRAAALVSAVLLLTTLTQSGEVALRAAVLASVCLLVATPGIRWIKHRLFEREARILRSRRTEAQTVLVVGGAGYIGSIVVRKLLSRGYRVRVLDSLVYGDSAIADVLDHPQLEFTKGDCRNVQDVVSVMAGVHSVVHLAAIVGDPACDRDHKTALEINYAATRMLIEIAKGEGVNRFLFASSCSVYGASDDLMEEGCPTRPLSLYAETKIDSERELLAALNPQFHPTILRFSTIFGLSPRPRFDLVVNLLTAKAMQEGVVTIYNGQQWRPFLHVADAAEAVVCALEAPAEVVSGQIYNVGDDRLNHTLTEIAQKIQRFFPDTRIEHVENADRRNYRVSFEKVRRQLGFRCSKTIDDGINELKEAFEKELIVDYLDSIYSNVKYLQERGSPVQTDEFGAQVMAALAHKGGGVMALAQKA